ncbi:superoxide dismutase family protein [Nocardioides sediminis]|uniref:superoxide dismutase family protein n=1 Tax=Nocardioides sediminis TaxID=433648 RepID=UPI000D31822F|nr:superoxide dismutase family protein [Nocardioides sediminis]
MRDTRSRVRLAMAGVAAVAVVGGSVAAEAGGGGSGHRHDRDTEVVTLVGVNGERIGWVKMREYHGRVVVSGWAGGLTPGFHGFHIHSVGLCEAGAPNGPFTTAAGHYAGAMPNHGDHAGDMPSLLVTASGDAWASFMTDRFTLDELRDTDGSAVMVHAGPDNFANIPTRYTAAGVPGPDATTLATGDAGARVACGVID